MRSGHVICVTICVIILHNDRRKEVHGNYTDGFSQKNFAFGQSAICDPKATHLLYYKCHKTKSRQGGSYIDSPEWIKQQQQQQKKNTRNPINKNIINVINTL